LFEPLLELLLSFTEFFPVQSLSATKLFEERHSLFSQSFRRKHGPEAFSGFLDLDFTIAIMIAFIENTAAFFLDHLWVVITSVHLPLEFLLSSAELLLVEVVTVGHLVEDPHSRSELGLIKTGLGRTQALFCFLEVDKPIVIMITHIEGTAIIVVVLMVIWFRMPTSSTISAIGVVVAPVVMVIILRRTLVTFKAVMMIV